MRWPSGTQPIASKPEPVIELMVRQRAASPGLSRCTRGSEFLSGVMIGIEILRRRLKIISGQAGRRS